MRVKIGIRSEFNSATMYRFATVAVLNGGKPGDHAAAFDGVARFIRAFALSMPTGHQTKPRPALARPWSWPVRQDQPEPRERLRATSVAGPARRYGPDPRRYLADFYQTEVQRWGDQPALVVASYNAVDGQGHEKPKPPWGQLVRWMRSSKLSGTSCAVST